jgi:hypothetical protein
MANTHDLSEWAAFLSLGTGLTATGWLLWLLLFEPLLNCDFDPRPAVRRAIESGRVDPVLCAVANTRCWAREKTRQAALSAAVFLLLLTAPKGVTR